MTELLRHPRAMETLQHEVRGLVQGKAEIKEDDWGNMQYLKAGESYASSTDSTTNSSRHN